MMLRGDGENVFCIYSGFNFSGIYLSHTSLDLLKMPSKFICILRITFCDTQLCGRCLVNMTPVVKVVIHCVFALL